MRTFLAASLFAFLLPALASTVNGGPVPAPPTPPPAAPPPVAYPMASQPPCYPSTVGGSGSTYVIGFNETGSYLGWWCPENGGWVAVVVVARAGYVVKHPPFNPDVSKLVQAYWDANVRDVPDSPEREALSNMAVADLGAVKPVIPTWTVAKNGDKLTRPAFIVTNGVRSFSSKSTVAVGAPCDMTTKIVEGSVTFGGVGSSLVAVCSKTP